MPDYIEELKDKVARIQKKQKKRLKNKKFSKLPREQKLAFSRDNKRLASYSYELYLKLKKSDQPENAVAYFYQAWKINKDRVNNEYLRYLKQKSKPTLSSKQLPDNRKQLFTLYLQYLLGVGQPQNLGNALVCLKKSANLGNDDAQVVLGDLYLYSSVIEKNNKKSLDWFERAAKKKNTMAYYYLGLMNRNGWGLKINKHKAKKWHHKAAEKGHAGSQYNLSTYKYWYDYIPWADRGEDSQEREESDRREAKERQLVAEWLGMAAEQGNRAAQYSLGEGHSEPVLGARLIHQSAEQGYKDASNYLSENEENLSIISFHSALFEENLKQVKSLLTRHPSFIKDLVWGLNHLNNKEKLQPAIRFVLENPSKFIKYKRALNRLLLNELKPLHQKGPLLNDIQGYFQKIKSHLDTINVQILSVKAAKSFIQLIKGVWHQSQSYDKDVQSRHEFTLTVTIHLRKLLKHLNSKDGALTHQKTLDVMVKIFVHQYPGLNFQVTLDFKQLMFFIAYVEFTPNFSVEKFNRAFSEAFGVKPSESQESKITPKTYPALSKDSKRDTKEVTTQGTVLINKVSCIQKKQKKRLKNKKLSELSREQQAAKWQEMAAKQADRVAQYNLGKLNLYSNIDNSKPILGARLMHQSAEQGQKKASDYLSENKKNLSIVSFHSALFEENLKQVKSLLTEHPSFIRELAWGLSHLNNKEKLQPAIRFILENPSIFSKYKRAFNRLLFNGLKLLHQKGPLLQDIQGYFQKIKSNLDTINVQMLSVKAEKSFIQLIKDVWHQYQSYDKEAQSRHEFTLTVTIHLRKLLKHLNSKDGALTHQKTLDVMAKIFVHQYPGLNFQVTPDFKQLMFFISYVEFTPNFSVEKFNRAFSEAFGVKPSESQESKITPKTYPALSKGSNKETKEGLAQSAVLNNHLNQESQQQYSGSTKTSLAKSQGQVDVGPSFFQKAPYSNQVGSGSKSLEQTAFKTKEKPKHSNQFSKEEKKEHFFMVKNESSEPSSPNFDKLMALAPSEKAIAGLSKHQAKIDETNAQSQPMPAK